MSSEFEREELVNVMVMTDLSDYAGTDMKAITQAVSAILAAGFRRTVQGEPTDAQVLAALNAMHGDVMPAPSLSYWGTSKVDYMRAALRAAAAVQEGENRG